ncbi:PocR ligand-binding domain-containing protein [Desulfovibrio sp. JC010]|uniref:PocR ligand-binding domain-containing protein n=1 Tax=Desulfovibrio sp. JC010 TaxID=2593641 RepID=UPI0013D42F92|nr:PocR ligand-binding domain-containing protein [Desulfovibrio sp. JC010]NDV26992.1 hypothetical protein [Desulfovibrio sp. JC010]
MLMTDLLSKEEWNDLERKVHEDWGFNASAYNADGLTFTGYKNFCNPLCAEIKSHPEGIQAICSVAHQHMSQLARTSGKTVIEECDSGMVKVCTPVIIEGEFVGIVGGCGRVLDDSEVETFTVHKAINIELERVENLADEVSPLTMKKAEQLAEFLEDFVKNIA